MTDSPLNYFNYFTEIEDFFVRKRGKHILLSPLDWTLMETWKEMEIPLHVVLRGIDRSMELYHARDTRTRYINSLYYCNQAVLEEQEKYLLSMADDGQRSDQTTESPEVSTPPADQRLRLALTEHLRRYQQSLNTFFEESPSSAPSDTLNRVSIRIADIIAEISDTHDLDPQQIERDLVSVDELLWPILENRLGRDEQKGLLRQCRQELKHHRKNLPPDMYEKILANLYHRKLKERFDIPDTSLMEML